MNWPLVELGSIASFINGFAFKPAHWEENGKPIIRIQNLTDPSKPFNYSSMDIPEKYHVVSGDLLVSWSATLDVFEWHREDALLNQHIFKVEPDYKKVNKDYLRYALRDAISAMLKFTRGSTMKHVNRGDFLGTKIPLPPLETQKKIAAVLEKADQLRKNCRQVEQELNSLAQSVFIDMFGEPITNPKEWDIKTLDDVCTDIYRYPTFYGFDYVDEGIPVVKIGNITKDGYVGDDLSKYDFMPESISKEYPRTILKLGDIVMAVRGDGSTGKRIGLVESENVVNGNISPNLIMYRANRHKVDPIFLYYFLTSNGGQKKIEKYISKTAKKTITGKDIKKIEIYCPPIELQKRFRAVYQETRNLLKGSTKIKDYDELFSSLMLKAFKGDLNL
ncbi:restriction endonuclease subunit S [Moritella marina ATCC 15381]|uniref:Restriction endonuclease subunit S n=1 Tax=Moritella marina ATCC 15381 TaxID=1202962 RepID=A0A5J6WHZ2_MORMI|nr:restriction endonuclease subunit S [Moritella marina]QFI36800.1 restriction endonuclease subunit S [Moritella marina ATCC 15381]